METTSLSAQFGGSYSSKVVDLGFDILSLNKDYVEKKLAIKKIPDTMDYRKMVVRSKLANVSKIERRQNLKGLGNVRVKKQIVVKNVRKLIN